MNSINEQLMGLGLLSEESVFKPYEKFSEFKLPFGCFTNEQDLHVGSEYANGLINSVNYIRRTAESMTTDKIKELCSFTVNQNDMILNFILENIDKVKLVNQGTIHVKSDGVIGRHTNLMERNYKRDTEYGFVDVIMMFVFDKQLMRIKPKVDFSAINAFYQSAIKEEAYNVVNKRYHLNEEEKLAVIKHFVEQGDMEFIPFAISEFDGVRISHRKYTNGFGIFHDEFTSPALGYNIRKHKDIMDGLKTFFEQGRMFDDRFYLICRSGDDFYLKRYREWDGEKDS